jgi:hypothetical protein
MLDLIGWILSSNEPWIPMKHHYGFSLGQVQEKLVYSPIGSPVASPTGALMRVGSLLSPSPDGLRISSSRGLIEWVFAT